MSIIGQRTRRLEGGEKVAGTTRFTADLELSGLLHVQLVLSHLASAGIRGIDTAAARSAPGVIGVFTGPDLPDVKASGPDHPLARGRVFYVGQPVAAVVAETAAQAWDAAALVEVDFDPRVALVTFEDAIQEGAPSVLDTAEAADEGDASMHGAATDSEATPVVRPPNVSAIDFKVSSGGAMASFRLSPAGQGR